MTGLIQNITPPVRKVALIHWDLAGALRGFNVVAHITMELALYGRPTEAMLLQILLIVSQGSV
jgi:hypothetical protein